MLRRIVEIQNQMVKKVCNFFSFSSPIIFRLKMAHKVRNANISLEKIKSKAILIGLIPMPSVDTPAPIRENRETDSFVDDSKIGREDDVLTIVNMLTSTNNHKIITVIPIVGMAGIGKTTLAQLIYKNEQVNEHFDVKIWVCVSENFNVKRIIKGILESIAKNEYHGLENLDNILKTIKKKLEWKKYLLVLDDVWNENPNKWDDLKSHLLAVSKKMGNVIVVTTRNDKVASFMETIPSYHLGTLSEEDCWAIFKQKVFASGGPLETSDLIVLGREIVKKCGGLPLAATVLGGIMHYKREKQDWLSILNSDIWDLPENEDGILPVLKLSFDSLPSSSLKRCFAYCAIFPKDFTIERDDLVELWMAQGLLQPSEKSRMEMEDLGYEYFKILLYNSLFQDATTDYFGNIQKCKMHDLVHDLAQSISRSEILALEASQLNETIPARHLSLISDKEFVNTIPKNNVRKLRTLFSKVGVSNTMLLNLGCLRILNLNRADLEELPISIGKLKHLRYLNVSWTNIKVLPKSIAKLYNLQTLKLMCCSSLEELPREMRKLIKLRHLHVDSDSDDIRKQMPTAMGRLVDLQTLPFFAVSCRRGYRIEELGPLNRLKGKLKIYNLEHVGNKEEAKRANLMAKTNIFTLGLIWSRKREGDDNINDEEVLEGLQPHLNLNKLKIENFGADKFPSWMTMMVNLQVLKIEECHELDSIPSIHGFTFLRKLVIIGCSALISLPRGLQSCKYLEELTVEECCNLTSIPNIQELCSLSILRIIDCETLMELPEGLLCCLTSLWSLTIGRFWEELDFFPSLLCRACSSCTGCSAVDLNGHHHHLISLEVLELHGWPELKSLPDQLQHLSRLRSMEIVDFDGLEALPEWLGRLSSLEKLEISGCENLQYLPTAEAMRRLSKLRWLGVFDCPLLEERCIEETGSEWSKISHIPTLNIV
ncbi:putative disease resistance protein RGA3 [Malania oleifera]|uniref:putative disease resistance protein RGA3 n=1 Tax=Malania oleifera TaxID=397392 RepID=UPI0025AE0B59|nr:putative disease resistance protein RGA3 [Malania oleifera]